MDYMPSAMKGVVLTSTGEILATPSPAKLVNSFNHSPKIGLNFGKVFDFEEGDSGEKDSQEGHDNGAVSPPPARAGGKRGGKQRIKTRTRTTHRRRILHPRLGRVRRTQESSKLSPQHHHRRGFVGPRYVPPIMCHEVNRQRYLYLRRILLVLASMAIPRRLQTGIVRPNPFPILIYDHPVVVPISPLLLPPPGHYQFQYRGAMLHPSMILWARRICLVHF
jgi:hypothetical protein